MSDMQICHCGEPAPLYDRLTALWQCLGCRYGVNDDCGCSIFVSPHAKAMWVRQQEVADVSDTRRHIPIKVAKYTVDDVRDAQRKAWEEGYLSQLVGFEDNPYKET